MAEMYEKALRESHVAAWRASGLTRKAYGDQHGINAHTFRGWCKRDGVGGVATDTSRVTLVPLRVTAPTAPTTTIELRCGRGVVLILPGAVAPEWLAEVVRRVSAC